MVRRIPSSSEKLLPTLVCPPSPRVRVSSMTVAPLPQDSSASMPPSSSSGWAVMCRMRAVVCSLRRIKGSVSLGGGVKLAGDAGAAVGASAGGLAASAAGGACAESSAHPASNRDATQQGNSGRVKFILAVDLGVDVRHINAASKSYSAYAERFGERPTSAKKGDVGHRYWYSALANLPGQLGLLLGLAQLPFVEKKAVDDRHHNQHS